MVVTRAQADPSIFIRVKYILKYTNRHICKNCPLIISLASAPAEGTEQAAPFKCKSGFNAEYQLEFSSSAQAQAVHSTTCGHFISIFHLVTLLNLFTTDYYQIRGIILITTMDPENVSRERRHLQ